MVRQKSIYGVMNKYGMFLKILGTGQIWVKVFLQMEVWVQEESLKRYGKLYKQNPHFLYILKEGNS